MDNLVIEIIDIDDPTSYEIVENESKYFTA